MEVLPRRAAHRSADRRQDRLIPDDDDPNLQGHRFLRAAYRTTRALLICKELLNPGQSLYEAIVTRLEESILDTPARISTSSAFASITTEAGLLPTAPVGDSSPEDVEKIATCHGFAAIELGYDPEDPCLHWFRKELIEEFFPSADALIAFELSVVEAIGKVSVRNGRVAALTRLQRILGQPSHLERKDWAGLTNAYLRDFAGASLEDDRMLMIARLERIAANAREALDLRTELAANNALAKVQGLTFIDDTKSQREMVLLLGNRNGRPDAPVPQLPS